MDVYVYSPALQNCKKRNQCCITLQSLSLQNFGSTIHNNFGVVSGCGFNPRHKLGSMHAYIQYNVFTIWCHTLTSFIQVTRLLQAEWPLCNANYCDKELCNPFYIKVSCYLSLYFKANIHIKAHNNQLTNPCAVTVEIYVGLIHLIRD